MLALLLIPALIYGLLCALLFAFQTRALFPVAGAVAHGPLPVRSERLELVTGDGARLVGLHPKPAHTDPAMPVILGFGGNAWNADNVAEYLRDAFPGADVIAFHYRGYRPSGGLPSAKALLADSLLVHDKVAEIFRGRPIVAVGFSIGSGVAAHVASRRRLAGVILVTPFDSLAAVAAGHYPWLPVRALFRHPMEPAVELCTSRVPTAILAAGRDTLIPAARTDALRKAVPNLVFDRTIAGVGHNDIYRSSAFQHALDEALAKILAAPSAK